MLSTRSMPSWKVMPMEVLRMRWAMFSYSSARYLSAESFSSSCCAARINLFPPAEMPAHTVPSDRQGYTARYIHDSLTRLRQPGLETAASMRSICFIYVCVYNITLIKYASTFLHNGSSISKTCLITIYS